MPANLLIVPLLVGYWFIHFCYYFRFRSQSLDGYRLLIESGIAGAIFLLLGRGVAFLASSSTLLSPLVPVWSRFAPFEFSGTAAATFGIGLVAPFVANLFVSREWARRKAVKRNGSALLRLLHEAAESSETVSLTLDSRKTYIGYVLDAPNLAPFDSYVEIHPVMSGYRDKDTLDLKLTTSYLNRLSGPEDVKSFAVYIPVSTVRMASYFDLDLLDYFDIPRSFKSRDPEPDFAAEPDHSSDNPGR